MQYTLKFGIGTAVTITRMNKAGLGEPIPGVVDCVHIDREFRVHYYVQYMAGGEIKQETLFEDDLEAREG